MDILTANQDTTTRFAVTIEEINSKYKKKKEDLKRLIAKTAISQAQQILAELSNDNISNPEQLCKKITCMRLRYNSIGVKQKKEIDSVMNSYEAEICKNMKIVEKLIKPDERIRLDICDKYIVNCGNYYGWLELNDIPQEKNHMVVTQGAHFPSWPMARQQNNNAFSYFKHVLHRRINESTHTKKYPI
jgi:hypothetical protein